MPGLVIGTIALVIGAGAGAYAATTGGAKITVCVHSNGGGLYQARKCAKRDTKLSWNTTGLAGAPGKNGTNGTDGTDVTDGTDGSAVAYAHISQTGTLDTANSKNVSAAALASSGVNVYCMSVAVPVRNASVTVDDGGSEYPGFASVDLSGQDPNGFFASFCPTGGYNVAVVTLRDDGGTIAPDPMAFWVTFN